MNVLHSVFETNSFGSGMIKIIAGWFCTVASYSLSHWLTVAMFIFTVLQIIVLIRKDLLGKGRKKRVKVDIETQDVE